MKKRLEGRVAIVTGAGQGIGYAIGQRFAEEGAHVVVAEINPATVHQAAADFSRLGPAALGIEIDVSAVERLPELVQTVVQKFGRVDILVNNAGISNKAGFLEMTTDQWDTMQRVNQRAVFFCMQAVARQMVAQIPPADQGQDRQPVSRGKIINISSIAGRRGRADAMHYSVAKAAVITMTQGAGMALAKYGINVNAICPSVVPTAMWEYLDRVLTEEHGMPRGEWYRQRVEKIPLKRESSAAEVAALVAFLASPESDYITAQTYNVDGGSELN